MKKLLTIVTFALFMNSSFAIAKIGTEDRKLGMRTDSNCVRTNLSARVEGEIMPIQEDQKNKEETVEVESV